MATVDNNKPLFAVTPIHKTIQISAANTNRDGSGTVSEIYTATEKMQIAEIGYKAIVTTTAGMIRIFVKEGEGNFKLKKEISVPAVTPSATVQSAEGSLTFSNWIVPAGTGIYATNEKAEAINIYLQAAYLSTTV